MKTSSKYLLGLLIVASSLIFADEEKRIEPLSRRLSEDQIKEIQNIEKEKSPSQKKLLGFFDNQYPPLVFDQYVHNLSAVSILGDYLIIEDGSQWSVKPGCADEIFTWKEKDPVFIILNDSFISFHLRGYKYKMINKRKNTCAEVKLYLGPLLNNPYSLQILSLNPITLEVMLSDNSIWKCDPSQYYLFDKWLAGDGIIVGTNVKGWFNASYNNLLINVNLLEEIRSNRIE